MELAHGEAVEWRVCTAEATIVVRVCRRSSYPPEKRLQRAPTRQPTKFSIFLASKPAGNSTDVQRGASCPNGQHGGSGGPEVAAQGGASELDDACSINASIVQMTDSSSLKQTNWTSKSVSFTLAIWKPDQPS